MKLHETVQPLAGGEIDLAIGEFMLHQKSSRHSPYTVAHYGNSLKHFKCFMERNELSKLDEIRPGHIRLFFVELQDSFKPKTAHGIASDVRAFFSFHEQEGTIEKSPVRRVELPKLDKTILPPFTEEEVQRMLKARSGKDAVSVRDTCSSSPCSIQACGYRS